jgi:hypothetical protein
LLLPGDTLGGGGREEELLFRRYDVGGPEAVVENDPPLEVRLPPMSPRGSGKEEEDIESDSINVSLYKNCFTA